MFETLKDKFLRRKMRLGLIKRYQLEIKAEELMEDWKTHKILEGGDETYLAKGRGDLAHTQARLMDMRAMVEFFKNLK